MSMYNLSKEQYDIVIFVTEINNRINYIFSHIFNILGLKLLITNNKDDFFRLSCPKLNYSKNKFSDELFIKPHGILYEKGIYKQVIKSGHYKGLPVIFSDIEGSDFSFDIFSAVFYLITRYEEYLEFKSDAHGRFQPQDSIAYKNKFLDTPIVEKWIDVFRDFLKMKFPNLIFTERQFTYIPTVDVDNAFSYRHKGILLGSALIFRDIIKSRFTELNSRIKVILGLQKDPFDNFDFLHEKLKVSKNRAVVFFQAGKRGEYDKNTSLKKRAMKNLIKRISDVADTGVHPSYQSNTSINHVNKEKQALEKVLSKPIIKSRQHYLILNFPETYNNLIKIGIKEDYSLGYASTPGFRAGTCTPFNFYNLSEEIETDLKIIPFQLMDATFKSYLKISPEEAGKIMFTFFDKVKKVKGTLVIIWHNDSFSSTPEGAKWRQLFQTMLQI